ncbi:PaaI family thioesterase [Shinella sp. PSBB067]|uniref:PaaI family thioesterase n=1 Tax=unclassified Shinella TaxID=2643062 RepID=UPI000927602E|nr:PaaI family thioesterase [Shinella sp. PSBB067]MBN9056822.1 PaaI family thioesterase [Hyphomicrobiales bacterium]OJU86117.1 MAG: thioesterase [Shinella sp. 65-6]QRI64708.1 PaaI family thioesterase [Shinella sp. PSBB067]
MELTPVMDPEALNRFLETDFPQLHTDGKVFEVVDVSPGSVVMRLMPNERHLRPGGTVSGPTLFALADVGAYCAVLAHIGPVALAVTTNLNINFLRKPKPGPLTCTCRLLKLGKRLAVMEASIFDEDADDLVAHATATYSIPPR